MKPDKKNRIAFNKQWQRNAIKILLIFTGVMLVSLLASMQMSGQACVFEHKAIRFFHFLPVNLIYFACWGILFIGIHAWCHFLIRKKFPWFLTVLLHVAACAAFTLFHLAMLRLFIFAAFGAGIITVTVPLSFFSVFNRWIDTNIYIYIAIAGFLHFFYYYRQLRQKELKTSQLETEMIQVQLQSLKAQLHPHFLFNALNTITAYVKKQPDTAIKMIARLSALLRLTLETKTHHEIPLADEMEIVNHYLEIEKYRFTDRLEIKRNIAPDILNALVPALLLQPLVENAVRHGISHKIDKGTITIAAASINNNLHLSVQDDGPGLKEPIDTTDEKNSGGIGLANLNERLKKLYGNKAGFSIDNSKKKGFKITITLPLRFKDENKPAAGPQ